MIKLITFDLDNTLWDIDPVIIAAEKRMRLWLQQHLPEAVAHLELDQIKGIYKDIKQQHPELLHHPTNFRKKILYTVFRRSLEHNQASEMTERAFEVYYQGRNDITLFHQAEAILQALSQRFPLIALSNGNANLKMVGIDHYFKAHFSSETEGKAKPHSAMFLKALQHAKVDAFETIHIGDHPKEDVEAARILGFHTIWFNENGEREKHLCQPSEQIQKLDQLLTAVDHIVQL